MELAHPFVSKKMAFMFRFIQTCFQIITNDWYRYCFFKKKSKIYVVCKKKDIYLQAFFKGILLPQKHKVLINKQKNYGLRN